MFFFFSGLFCRCALRYVLGDGLMDSHLVILDLDQWGVELVMSNSILLGE